jgi:putative membrane protein
MTKHPRRPTAFRLDELTKLDAGYEPGIGAPPALSSEPDAFAESEAEGADVAATPPRQGRRWSQLLAGAVGGLVVLAVGLAVDSLIEGLFARSSILGWLGIVLAGLAGIALLALAIREIVGLLRIRRIADIHQKAAAAAAADDREEARAVTRALIALYERRPEMARSRTELGRHVREIIDGRDLIELAETGLLLPLDEAARRTILASAKRVAMVTTISPRALVDLVFVGAEIIRLVRRLATLYGGRPGTLGFLKLTRAAIGHLAVTGGLAMGDSLVSQLLGHGLASRLSAKLGEGVVNGLLTARVGIAAIELCRPLPFLTGQPPRLADVMSELTKLSRMGKGA